MPLRWRWPFRKREPEAGQAAAADTPSLHAPEAEAAAPAPGAPEREQEAGEVTLSLAAPAEPIALEDQPWDFSLGQELLRRLAPQAEPPLLGAMGGMNQMTAAQFFTPTSLSGEGSGGSGVSGVPEFETVGNSTGFLSALPNLDDLLELSESRSEDLPAPEGLTDVLPPLQQNLGFRLGRRAANATSPQTSPPRHAPPAASGPAQPVLKAAGPGRGPAPAAPAAPVSVQRKEAGSASSSSQSPSPGKTTGPHAPDRTASASHPEPTGPAQAISAPNRPSSDLAARIPGEDLPGSPPAASEAAVLPHPSMQQEGEQAPRPPREPAGHFTPPDMPIPSAPRSDRDRIENPEDMDHSQLQPGWPVESPPDIQAADQAYPAKTGFLGDLLFVSGVTAGPDMDKITTAQPGSPEDEIFVQRWNAAPLSVQPWLEPPLTGTLGTDQVEAGTPPAGADWRPEPLDIVVPSQAGAVPSAPGTPAAPSTPVAAVQRQVDTQQSASRAQSAEKMDSGAPHRTGPAGAPVSRPPDQPADRRKSMLSIQLWGVNQMLQSEPASEDFRQLPGQSGDSENLSQGEEYPHMASMGYASHASAGQPASGSMGSRQPASIGAGAALHVQRFSFDLPGLGAAAGRAIPDMPLPNLQETAQQTLQQGMQGLGAENLGEQALGRITSAAPAAMEAAQGQGLPNIQRLTDEIWREIQRRMRIERERTRGLS